MSTTPSIETLLKYINLQMAAEAIYISKDKEAARAKAYAVQGGFSVEGLGGIV